MSVEGCRVSILQHNESKKKTNFEYFYCLICDRD